MTGPLRDDELRAMLGERASRLSPDVERAAMATFRATVRGASDGAGGFAVLPQALSSRGARLPWGVAALGMVAVVVVAVLGGRLGPEDVAATPTLAAASVYPADTPSTAAGPGVAGPDVLAADELEDAMASGDLARQIVVVVGRIAATDCESAIGCDYSIVGVPGVPVALGEDLVTGSPVAPAFNAAVRAYAFRVGENGVLTLLGVIGDGLETPLPVDDLSPTTAAGELILVGGWIVSPAAGSSTEPCAQPKLLPPECSAARAFVVSGARPGPEASVAPEHALPVTVAAGSRPGLFPPSGDAATFLVRRVDDDWRVEGRYVAIVERVAEPPSSLPDASMSADQLRSGLADGRLTGRLVVVDGDLRGTQVPCREALDCSVSTLPGLRGVPIAIDPALSGALATASPDGPLVFFAARPGLTFLGTMGAPTDWPITVGELAAADPASGATEVWLVAGALGIPLCVGGCPMSSAGPGPATWLSDPIGTGSPATVPVEVADPLNLRTDAGNRVLVRGSASGAWIVVGVVADLPIIRVTLP